MSNKGFKGYKKAPKDIEQAMARAVDVEDFLPSPKELLAEEKSSTKITISVSKRSLQLFKDYAKKNKGKYQAMIRRLLDAYAERALAH
jgi:predicted DNA binding CopG/RHH family protein